MKIKIKGAREHNLKNVNVEFDDGLTVVTGISGSGKTSLVFDTLFREARRRFQEIFARQTDTPVAVEAITGVGPAIAVGQNLLNRNPNSTLATAAGLHPFFRLLFANFAARNCPVCSTPLRVFSPDEIVEQLKRFAEKETLEVYVPLLHQVPGSHRTLLESLKNTFPEMTLWVDDKPCLPPKLDPALPHDIEIQLNSISPATPLAQIREMVDFARSLGSTAVKINRANQSSFLSFAPVCVTCGYWFYELKPLHFNQKCPDCHGNGCATCAGTGLPPAAAATRWENLDFHELQILTVEELHTRVQQAIFPETAKRLHFEINRRLAALKAVGLDYLNLNRSTPTLSRGEAQRVRLAIALTSRLEDMLHILDEPTIGLHPADVGRLIQALQELPGPIIFVEHDRQAAALANLAIDLGPGAGKDGGEVTFSGEPAGLWQSETATGRFFSFRENVVLPEHRPLPDEFFTLVGANFRNLKNIDVPIPTARLTVVTGVSGSGKSTLVKEVLVAALTEKKPIGCREIIGPKLKPVFVDQNPIGINPRSNPATYTKLADVVRDLFATATGLSASAFSFNRPEGACPTCNGMGSVEIKMRYLPSSWVTCSECGGQRFSDEVLAARVTFGSRSLSIADFFDLNISDVLPLLAQNPLLPSAKRQTATLILHALIDVGLGYLTLGQSSPTLSGGEAQRVKLAKFLSKKNLGSDLLILDEPSTGLHPQDISGLLKIFDRLVRSGATILVVEHNTDVIRAADWVVDLGPGAGAAGGKLLHAGTVASLLPHPVSRTARALREEKIVQPAKAALPANKSPVISIKNARVHNLKNISVEFPKGKLCVVTGVSGSGKSSLVHDVLETAARQRYLETLSMYERQGTREGPEAEADEISGLGVAVSIQEGRRRFNLRANLGLVTEISHHLAVLFANLGQQHCPKCGTKMNRGEIWTCPACGTETRLARPRHFSAGNYGAACQKCQGVGSLQMPNPDKLIIHPEKPLYQAMYSPGFFPQGYLCKPFNGGYDLVRALAEKYKFDPATTPWNQMRPEARHAFLFGDPEPMPVTYVSRSGRTGVRVQQFPGFYGWIRDWDVGGTYTDTQPCPECHGAKLRPEFLSVTFFEKNIHELSELTLAGLLEFLENAKISPFPHSLPPELLANHLRIILRRLKFLCQVGLNYLNLNRVVGTLSAGEAQRIRLAGALGSQMTALTVLLDEPTRGLHPVEVQALLEALQSLRDEGNTVIVVEHDPLVIRAADFLLDLGPGAGTAGGEIVASGTPEEVLQAESITGQWLRKEKKFVLKPDLRPPENWLTIFGATENNLQIDRLDLPLNRLVGICGVSGSGKSTLLIDTLGRVLAPKKQTTSVAYEPIAPGRHEKIENAPSRTILIDQSKAGVTSPVDFLNLTRQIHQLFADSADARALGMDSGALSRSCTACNGQGVQQLEMDFLPSVQTVCEVCQGSGYPAEAWHVKIQGISLPELMHKTFDEIAPVFPDSPLKTVIEAVQSVGLGYLVLRQPGVSLSGGEAQRLKIVQELSRKTRAGTLYILDEPTVGQHLEDVNCLIGVLRQLVAAGNSVLVVEHHAHFLAACDWLVELGPGGGPEGGHVVASGTPNEISRGATPIARFLREIWEEK